MGLPERNGIGSFCKGRPPCRPFSAARRSRRTASGTTRSQNWRISRRSAKRLALTIEKILCRIIFRSQYKLPVKPKSEEVRNVVIDKIALALLVIGGLVWGGVGLFQFDLVAFAFGGSASMVSRIFYTIVGLSAVWCISLLFRDMSDKKN